MEATSVRVVCISDTHGKHASLEVLPDGDILIHAGDFTNTGELPQVKEFLRWFDSQPHRVKILIAGNHDTTMHEEYYRTCGADRFHLHPYNLAEVREAVRSCTGVTYLEDSGCEAAGLYVYGSPWQPEFCNWAFNLPIGPELRAKWEQAPPHTDILITHGPPHKFGDWCYSGIRCGCPDLLDEIRSRIRPAVHIFGHIHESYGVGRDPETGTLFVNASTCTFRYRPTNAPIVVDVTPDVAGNARVVAPADLAAADYEGRASSEDFMG